MNIDEKYMRLALALAKKGAGHTSPNPAVGAVIVKNGRVVGSGYHKRCGSAHAEVNALAMAGAAAGGATLYVTMEPCNHFGRTPPCTEAIIAGGIKNVIIAMKDPNPVTNGRGIRTLHRHGIKTAVGLFKEEAAALNRPFIKSVTRKLPFVTVKIAESLDGKIATRTGDSRWITGEDSRRYVHKLRGMADAVMVGAHTAAKDDPLLLCGIKGARQPARIIVDSGLKTPPGLKIFRTSSVSPVILAATGAASLARAKRYQKKGARVLFLRAKCGRVDLKDLFRKLAGMGIIDVLVEGGGTLIANIVEERLADRFLFFIAPKIIGGAAAVTSVEGKGVARIRQAVTFSEIAVKKFKKDILIEVKAS